MQCGLSTFGLRDICLYNFPIVLIGFMNYSLANWVLISILSLPFRPASGTWPSLIRLNYMKTFCVLLTVQVSLRCDRQIIFDSGDMMPYKLPEVSHFHFPDLVASSTQAWSSGTIFVFSWLYKKDKSVVEIKGHDYLKASQGLLF